MSLWLLLMLLLRLYCCSRVTISSKDSILCILPEWLDRILAGEKTAEIRGKPCPDKIGKQIWLRASGSGIVTGRATVIGCVKLTQSDWKSMRSQHLVPGERLYGDRTHAWLLADVQRVAGIPIARKRGCVDWQTGPE